MNDSLKQQFISLRKKYIASCFSNLNPMQQKAVLKTEGPLLLLAGAGSGKTTVLIRRVVNLLRFGCGSDSQYVPAYIQDEDVAYLEECIASYDHTDRADLLCKLNAPYPSNIIAITFTNKAANELKERLLQDVGPESQSVWAMTFHSACCRILRREIDRLGYSTEFTIYDAQDSERVIKDVLKDFGLDEKTFSPKMILRHISDAKDCMKSPEQYASENESVRDPRARVAIKCYDEYQKRLRTANALDFDDIIFLTVQLFREYPEVLEHYSSKFRYVLVDEYQDTNHAQYLLTSQLASVHNNICVVGDDDQSIYKFRGATIENILEFENQYKGAAVIRLEQNYRSTKSILEAANEVISHNKGRKGKRLWTQNQTGESVTVKETANQLREAEFISSQIMKRAAKDGFKSCAILYRTNAQSNALETNLASNGIPSRVYGGMRFFERAEIKDIISYLTLVHNHTDNLRLKRIINNPPRGIGDKSLESAQRLSESQNLPLYDIILHAEDYPALAHLKKKFSPFTDLIEELSFLADRMALPEFYDALLDKSGYLAMLQEKNTIEMRTKADNVLELRSNFVTYCAQNDPPTLAGFLEEISLYTDLEAYNAEDDAVTMMTIHSAKGLEFDHVFLAGMEEGLFPSSKSADDTADLEEERRLCYVAITRAKKSLTLTFADERLLFGRTSYARPSRFLDELPETCRFVRTSKSAGSPRTFNRFSEFDYNSGYEARFFSGGRASQTTASGYAGHQSSSYPEKKKTAPDLKLKPGDSVVHKTFGRGMVISVTDLKGDAILEIIFDKVGTKKMLLNSVSSLISKE